MKNKMNCCKKSLNLFLKIISILLIIFIVLLTIFILYYCISVERFKKKGSEYKPFISLYTIISTSMVPELEVYDVIVNTKVNDINKIEKGDVITFISMSSKSYGLIVTHKVVEKNTYNGETYLITKGNNNPVNDTAPVYYEQILGKVKFVIPGFGKIQHFVSDNNIFLYLAIIPAFSYITYDLIKIKRKKNKRKTA